MIEVKICTTDNLGVSAFTEDGKEYVKLTDCQQNATIFAIEEYERIVKLCGVAHQQLISIVVGHGDFE